MLRISQLYIYPVKSLGGIQMESVELEKRGFRYDRRWMLVDSGNRFLTQREHPEMALLECSINNKSLLVHHKKYESQHIEVSLVDTAKKLTQVKVWDDVCLASEASEFVNEWFCDMLNIQCKLVYMPENSLRKVDPEYAVTGNEITSFSDGYPLLLIGQASLDHLNGLLSEKLPMNRFRPNIVFEGGKPHEEDQLEHFSVGTVDFFGVKPCARCVVTTTNQNTGMKGKEPLQTLARYRLKNKKIYFGMNLLHQNNAVISTGDIITIKKLKEPFIK